MHKTKPRHLLRWLVAIPVTFVLVLGSLLGSANAMPASPVATVEATCGSQLVATNLSGDMHMEFYFMDAPGDFLIGDPVVVSPGQSTTVTVPSTASEVDWFALETLQFSVVASGTVNVNHQACPVEPVVIPVPDQPSVNDPCGPDNASWIVPENTDSVTWTPREDGHLVATANDGYVFDNGETEIDYGTAPDSGEACPVEPPVPPVDPDPGNPGEPGEPGEPEPPVKPVPPGDGGDDSTPKDDDTDSDKENVKSDKDNSDTKSSKDEAGKTSADDTPKGQSDKVNGPELKTDGVTPFDFTGLKGLLIALAVLAGLSALSVGIAARLGHTQP